MADKTIKGITIEVGGETRPLQKAFDDVNKKTKDLQNELKSVDRLLKLDPQNTELLAQKQKLLAEQVENSKEKLDRLRIAQEKVEAAFKKGEIGEEQYRHFQRQVINAEQDLKKFEKQLKETGNAAKKLDTDLKGAGEKLKGMGQTLSMAVTAPIVGAFALVTEGTRELRGDLGTLETNAKMAGQSMGAVNEAMTKMAAVTGETDSNVEGLSNILAAGFKDEKLTQLVDALAGASIKFKDTLKFEGISDGLQETLATGAAIGPFAELLDRSSVSLDDFNAGLAKAKKNGTEQEYVLEVLAKTGLADVYTAYRETNQEMVAAAESQYDLQKSMAGLGKTLEPILTPIIKKITELLNKFNEMSPAGQKIALTLAGIAAAIGPLLIIIGSIAGAVGSISALFGGFSLAAGGAGAAAAGTGTALAGLLGPIAAVIAIIALVVAAIKDLWTNNEEFRNSVIEVWEEIKQSIKEAIEQITAWWKKWGPAIMKVVTPVWEAIKTVIATAVKVIGRVISLLLNVLTGDWKGAWEDIKGIAKAVWDGIKGILQAGVNFVKGLWNLLIQVVKEKFTGVLNYFRSIPDQVAGFFTNLPQKIGYQIGLLLGTLAKFGLDALNWARTEGPKIVDGIVEFFKELPGKILAWLIQALNRVAGWGKDLLAWAKTELPKIVQGIADFFEELPGKLLDIGKRIVEGLWNGIQEKAAWLAEQITGFVKGVVAGFTVPLKVESPSRVFIAIGKNIVEGLGNGIRDNAGYALDEIKKLGDQLLNTGNAISTGILRTDEKTGQVIYDQAYETVMKKIDLYYKERDRRVALMTDGTDDNIKQIEREIDATQKATDIKLKLYEQEYQAKSRLVDDAADARVRALQKEIDAIDKINEQEERGKEEREYQEKMTGLYAQYEDAAGNGDEEAAQRLLTEIRQAEVEHQEKLVQQERRERQEQLREQIELAREEAAQKKAALEEELEEKRYNLEQQRIAEIEHMNKILALMQEQVKLKEELEKVQTDIKDREQKLQTEGQSEEAKKQTENELAELLQREKGLKESIGNNQTTLENWTPQLQMISNRYGQVLLSGFKSTEGQIRAYIDSLVEYMRQKLAEIGVGGALPADGSHAAGLAYVPYDNYRAILHEGERVLTKAENREYREGEGWPGGDVNVTQHIYSPKADPREEQRRAARAFKKLALGV